MRRYHLFLAITFVALSVFSFSQKLSAAPYFTGKTVVILVGFEPGGGYDRYARILAKHLSKHIPGKPKVVVSYMPGAGGILAANYMYNIAKPDGLTIGSIERGLPFGQLLKVAGVKCDVTKFSWVGALASETSLLVIRTDLPYKNIDDLRRVKKPLYMAAVSKTSQDYQYPTLLQAFAGLNLQTVIYPSGSAGILAMERKEADGRGTSYNAIAPYIERGLVRPVLRGRESIPAIEKLPVDEDIATDKMGKAIFAMRSAADRPGRPYVAPPGTPSDVMNILRDSFSKLSRDPEVQMDAKKMQLAINYVSADECLKVLYNLLNQPEDVNKEFRKYITY